MLSVDAVRPMLLETVVDDTLEEPSADSFIELVNRSPADESSALRRFSAFPM